jgi:hypothetical protein
MDGGVTVDPLTPDGRALRYQAQVLAPDPRAYSQDLVTLRSQPMGAQGGGDTYPEVYPITFNPSNAGVVNAVNRGRSSTPPIYELSAEGADLVNPRIVRVPSSDTTPEVRLAGTIAAGQRVFIDVANRRVLLNGTVLANYLVDWSVSTLADLPRGQSTVRLIADSSSPDATLTVYFRHAY